MITVMNKMPWSVAALFSLVGVTLIPITLWWLDQLRHPNSFWEYIFTSWGFVLLFLGFVVVFMPAYKAIAAVEL